MNPLVSFVQTTAYESTPSLDRLPPFVWTAFTALNQVHSIWRWYRRVELYRNPDNFAQLLGGHLVHLVLGDVVLLRIAAQCLLISTRILECVQQQRKVRKSFRRWMVAVKGHYPMPYDYSWEHRSQNTWLSPSVIASIHTQGHFLWNRMKRIAKCTTAVFVQLFQLSMRLMDVVDTFCLSPYTRNEGIQEGFVNAMKWLDRLVANKEDLLNGITTNRPIIERILKGSPLSYEQLYTNINKTIEKTEVVYKKAKAVSEFGNGIIVEVGKRALSGGFVMMGLADYCPTALASTKPV
jgi:hypothetical protein